MKLKRVILLGAGASKSYDASKSKVRMPIANDFFKTFNQLSVSKNPWVLIGYIIQYVKEYRGIHIQDFQNYNEDIEDLHSEIEEKLYNILREYENIFETETEEQLASNDTIIKAYYELIFLFVSVINEVQNGDISESHVELAKQLTENDCIITFNWDTLMDRALADVSDWNTDNGYFVTPKSIYRDLWITPNKTSKEYPYILKLHGSSNWLTSYTVPENGALKPTQELSTENFCVYESNIKPFSCHAGRYSDGYEDFSYGYYPPNLPLQGKSAPDGMLFLKSTPHNPFMAEPTSDDKGLTSMPLIIPPVKNKEYDSFGDLFQRLWDKAESEIVNADEIFIIGYSFPKTDYRSSELFTRAFLKRKDMPKITIINPEPELIAERFKYDFGITEENLEVKKDFFTKETKITYG